MCEIKETMMSDLAASSELSAVHNVNSSCIDNAGEMPINTLSTKYCVQIMTAYKVFVYLGFLLLSAIIVTKFFTSDTKRSLSASSFVGAEIIEQRALKKQST